MTFNVSESIRFCYLHNYNAIIDNGFYTTMIILDALADNFLDLWLQHKQTFTIVGIYKT